MPIANNGLSDDEYYITSDSDLKFNSNSNSNLNINLPKVNIRVNDTNTKVKNKVKNKTNINLKKVVNKNNNFSPKSDYSNSDDCIIYDSDSESKMSYNSDSDTSSTSEDTDTGTDNELSATSKTLDVSDTSDTESEIDSEPEPDPSERIPIVISVCDDYVCPTYNTPNKLQLKRIYFLSHYKTCTKCIVTNNNNTDIVNLKNTNLSSVILDITKTNKEYDKIMDQFYNLKTYTYSTFVLAKNSCIKVIFLTKNNIELKRVVIVWTCK